MFIDTVNSIQWTIFGNLFSVTNINNKSLTILHNTVLEFKCALYVFSNKIFFQGLVLQNEQNYKNHLSFKSNCDSLVTWMRQLREKIPPVTRSLSDRLNLESSASVLEVSLHVIMHCWGMFRLSLHYFIFLPRHFFLLVSSGVGKE